MADSIFHLLILLAFSFSSAEKWDTDGGNQGRPRRLIF